jgi:hypothetical protein
MSDARTMMSSKARGGIVAEVMRLKEIVRPIGAPAFLGSAAASVPNTRAVHVDPDYLQARSRRE